MRDTKTITMNELMNNYREFKEAMKERFFFDDLTEINFEVETGTDRVEECGGQHFKSLYSAYKYVQRIFAGCEYERDENYCQINMFYTENGVEGIENLCNFEKTSENTVSFRNWL